MKTFWRAGVIALAVAIVGWASYQTLAQSPEGSMARLMPRGAVLFIEANDFAGLLHEWTSSPEQSAWLKSDSYKVFSNSRLLLRLKQLQGEFQTSAGIPPDMNLLNQVAGGHSALGIYDIGNFEILYITRLPSAQSMQTLLWQKRSQFSPRQAGKKQFFARTDPESGRVTAFAVSGDYLILGTQEDLVAGALSLIAGEKLDTLAEDGWYAKAVSAAKSPGELRMAINLAEVSHAPQFRTYWIQQNITDMQQYEYSISDLHRSGNEYREERVLLRAEDAEPPTVAAEKSAQRAVGELASLVPPDAGFYQVTASPSQQTALSILETKILTPRLGPAPVQKLAPSVSLSSGTVGSESDLETRIDVAPVQRTNEEQSDSALRQVLAKTPLKAILQLQRSELAEDGVFVRLRSTIVLASDAAWDEQAVRNAVQQLIAPGLTTSNLGANWKAGGNGAWWETDGLGVILAAKQGNYLVISNDSETVTKILQRMKEPAGEDADYVTGFNHARERQNFYRLTSVVDRASRTEWSSAEAQFFSQNLTSLSQAFRDVTSETVTIRRDGAQEFHTVRYQWAR